MDYLRGCMGTITVNVTDETETLFRGTVQEKLGKEKGVLGKALDEAMKKWAEEKRQEALRQRLLQRMIKGFAMGEKLYKKRADFYG